MVKDPLCNSSGTKRVDRHPRALQRKDLLRNRAGSRAWGWCGAPDCIDAKTGKVVWKNTDIGRTIFTISVADDLVYLAEYAGIIHCLDANTGKVYWTYDSFGVFGARLGGGRKVLLETKTETSWSWIMARTNPRSNWLAWGLPSTVHRFLQTERCTSRPKPTCTPSASDDERLLQPAEI